MKLPTKSLERKLFINGYRYIVAVDEVGMGCLAGPVVVCATMFDKVFFEKKHKKLGWLRDSKLLQAKQREEFAGELLKEKSFQHQISYCFPKTIDKLNIYQAARRAMKRAVQKVAISRSNLYQTKVRPLSHMSKVIVLIDGKTKIKGLSLEQMAIVKGDRKVFSIACASILAKVFRDKMMTKYAQKFPGYGFEKHKGYGTKEHKAQLAKLGVCPIHRKSFAPVTKLV